MSTHSYITRIPAVAHHGPSDAPEHGYTSNFYIAVATSLSPDFQPAEKKSLAILGILWDLRWSLQNGNTGWKAGSGRSDWLIIYVG